MSAELVVTAQVRAGEIRPFPDHHPVGRDHLAECQDARLDRCGIEIADMVDNEAVREQLFDMRVGDPEVAVVVIALTAQQAGQGVDLALDRFVPEGRSDLLHRLGLASQHQQGQPVIQRDLRIAALEGDEAAVHRGAQVADGLILAVEEHLAEGHRIDKGDVQTGLDVLACQGHEFAAPSGLDQMVAGIDQVLPDLALVGEKLGSGLQAAGQKVQRGMTGLGREIGFDIAELAAADGLGGRTEGRGRRGHDQVRHRHREQFQRVPLQLGQPGRVGDLGKCQQLGEHGGIAVQHALVVAEQDSAGAVALHVGADMGLEEFIGDELVGPCAVHRPQVAGQIAAPDVIGHGPPPVVAQPGAERPRMLRQHGVQRHAGDDFAECAVDLVLILEGHLQHVEGRVQQDVHATAQVLHELLARGALDDGADGRRVALHLLIGRLVDEMVADEILVEQFGPVAKAVAVAPMHHEGQVEAAREPHGVQQRDQPPPHPVGAKGDQLAVGIRHRHQPARFSRNH